MTYKKFTPEHLKSYEQDGYVIIKEFFGTDEVALLLETYHHDKLVKDSAINVDDNSGLNTKLTLWYNAGDDIYGAFSKSERVVDGLELIFGDKAALYHTKFMQKEPKIGGAWEWHQDYGYWYDNGFLLPEMLSVMVAVTRANKENGCLQVLKGSHKIGRINHGSTGEQVGADIKRVDAAIKRMELVYVELEPGDTLFFHGNLLHKSDANTSDHARFSLISAYNLASNRSFMNEPEASHTPVVKVDNDAILKVGKRGVQPSANFLNKQRDESWKKSIKEQK
ncbi:MAG: phytanoyl-CoA dioxygenase family protein [Cyclobacteriaceae bacterium]|nr:phytanoyl-CoA dioxygenase family protein [Cyclobacteriaceae bacterium]